MMSKSPFKVVVCFERRPDGGLRAYSEDVPGLVLSHTDIDGVLEDVVEALKVILSHKVGAEIDVQPLPNMREALESRGIVDPRAFIPGPKEYVATCH